MDDEQQFDANTAAPAERRLLEAADLAADRRDMADHLDAFINHSPDLAETRDRVLARRKRAQARQERRLAARHDTPEIRKPPE